MNVTRTLHFGTINTVAALLLGGTVLWQVGAYAGPSDSPTSSSKCSRRAQQKTAGAPRGTGPRAGQRASGVVSGG